MLVRNFSPVSYPIQPLDSNALNNYCINYWNMHWQSTPIMQLQQETIVNVYLYIYISYITHWQCTKRLICFVTSAMEKNMQDILLRDRHLQMRRFTFIHTSYHIDQPSSLASVLLCRGYHICSDYCYSLSFIPSRPSVLIMNGRVYTLIVPFWSIS